MAQIQNSSQRLITGWLQVCWLRSWCHLSTEVISKEPVWGDLIFVTPYVVLQEAAIRRWWATVLTDRMWSLNDAQLILRDPKYAKKLPASLHQPELRSQMDPRFQIIYAKFRIYCLSVAGKASDRATFSQFSSIQLWWAVGADIDIILGVIVIVHVQVTYHRWFKVMSPCVSLSDKVIHY